MGWDKTWDEIFKDQGWGMYPGEEVIQFMANFYYKAPRRNLIKVLDAGCGTGANSWYLAREGFSVVGVDGSETGIEICKQRFKKENLKGEFLVQDLTQPLPFPENHFDVIIDREMTSCHLIAEIKSVVENLYRVLKPGGRYFSMMLMDGSYGDGIGEYIAAHTYITQTHKKKIGQASTKLIHYTSRSEIDDIFKKFSDIDIGYKIIGNYGLHTETKEFVITATK